ncbi:protein NRT1/ PTR FAMILY 7.1-like isoform X2 [Andrographis paniculata]|uniref:protein NRT1/ PTR FAMILY 7.1-like isoform X2 n=1 Tax=Andrographis paniculata TaxID=175694 RepID=UPI0021E7CD5D|nr:protein NRT1/ PTR FAMILY 7.1-like isoform X2 [Andrographis paniculata]
MEAIPKGTIHIEESLQLSCEDNAKAVKNKKSGGWGPAALLLLNQGLATLAFFGVGVNLVLFLTRVLGQDNASAANNVSKWTGTVYLCSLVGAFLSDSYWGRYLTCALFQVIFVMGLLLISLSSWFMLLEPRNCGDGTITCKPSTSSDTGKWTLGFWLATGSAVLALIAFLLGSSRYRYVEASGNPIPRVMQVFVAAFRKWNVTRMEGESLYEVEGFESAIQGSRKINHSDEFAFLDKAAVVTEEDRFPPNPWRLCTITQVEEVKCLFRMLPIWLCTITYSLVFSQMASVFVEQGDVMNSDVGKFHIPAASMSAFDICSVLIFTGIYRQIITPIAKRLTGNPRGLTELQRMGIGIIISMHAMVAAGVTEMERLKRVIPGVRVSPMSIFWQIPQYVLVGASEVFMYVGQLEFFNGQAPDGIKSFGSSLCMASISLGNFVSSMLVNVVMRITTGGNRLGWIPENLNLGHMDRFYFLIAALTAVDFVVYVFAARWYKAINFEESSHSLSTNEEEG